MTMSRIDLTEWIIHFVHKRNPENEPIEFSFDPETFDEVDHPIGFSYDGEPIFHDMKWEDAEYGLESDASAFSVLKKILHDGYIKAGWSYRKMRPTIYGPKAAVCFTEMPLYSLIEYAQKRNNINYTEQYGIAFLRNELFIAGARPVIYGVSTLHKEAIKGDPYYGIGLRTLASEVGIGLKEQYRYVYTKLGASKSTDWTHEREWRWADLDESLWFPGMPVFADNDHFSFSKIIVIVKTTEEVEDIINQLRNLYHSKSTNSGRAYNLGVIENTYVLALDDLSKITKEANLVKLEDLPLHSMPKIEKIIVKEQTIEKVKQALAAASEIHYNNSKEYFEKNGDTGPCGYASVITWDSSSEITQALIDLERVDSYADGYYHINKFKSFISQSIDVNEAGAIAAAKYLTKELAQHFSYQSRWD